MPRHGHNNLDDSVDAMIREFRENRGMDVESEDEQFFEALFETAPSPPDVPVMRNQAVAALNEAMETEWMSPMEKRRLMSAFHEALASLLQSEVGESKLRCLGKGSKRAEKRKARRA